MGEHLRLPQHEVGVAQLDGDRGGDGGRHGVGGGRGRHLPYGL